MNSKKGFIALTGGICFTICALATATVVAEEVSAKDGALTVVEVIQGDKALNVAEASQVACLQHGCHGLTLFEQQGKATPEQGVVVGHDDFQLDAL